MGIPNELFLDLSFLTGLTTDYSFEDGLVAIACVSDILPISQPLQFSDDSILVEIDAVEYNFNRRFGILCEILFEVSLVELAFLLAIDTHEDSIG